MTNLRVQPNVDLDELAPRQRRVAMLMMLGLTDHEIADRIGTPADAAGSEASATLLKLQFRSRKALIVWYNRQAYFGASK